MFKLVNRDSRSTPGTSRFQISWQSGFLLSDG